MYNSQYFNYILIFFVEYAQNQTSKKGLKSPLNYFHKILLPYLENLPKYRDEYFR